MDIQLNDNLTLDDIQQEFEKKFYYLKLMFFKKSHVDKKGSPKKDLLSGNTKLININHKNGKIVFDENIPVTELEKLFKENFGLNVQVFRKSGKSWIETTVTDSWTLKKQNDQGKELSELSF
jgi:hypothetical protein